MTRQDLRTKVEADPFRPFVIRLAGGREIFINDAQTEFLFPRIRPELILAFSEDRTHEFEIGSVLSLIEA